MSTSSHDIAAVAAVVAEDSRHTVSQIALSVIISMGRVHEILSNHWKLKVCARCVLLTKE